jgi:phosphoribosylformimino-5-aminoimidazole carboxamide ribonucleotide (ProFAR) isomerase
VVAVQVRYPPHHPKIKGIIIGKAMYNGDINPKEIVRFDQEFEGDLNVKK